MNITNTKNLRQINREKVKKALLENGECNKNQISQYTSLSKATITNILKELIETNEVIQGDGFASTGGRCAKSYKLNGNYLQFIAISFVRCYSQVFYILRVYNNSNQILYEKKSETEVIKIEMIIDDITIIMKKYTKVEAITISIPAILEENGNITDVSMKGFQNKDLKRKLEDNFSCQVIIENDVNVAAIGYYSENPEQDYFSMLYQPKDELVGAAYIYKGQLIKGKHNLAGELAYLPFIDQQAQYQMLSNDEDYINLIVKFIITIIVTHDPNLIIVSGENIDLNKLKHHLKSYLPKSLLPEIVLIENITKYIFSGLLFMAHDAINTNLIMTTRTIY